jgi:hypothetical protein
MSKSRFNFRQAGGARKYRPWKQWAEGDYVIGVFKDTYTDKFRNEGWIIEVIECDFKDSQAAWNEGDVVGLNAAGGLAYSMEEAQKGAIVRIEYNGLDTLTSGDYKGSEVHTFKVGIDDSKLDSKEIKRVQDAKNETETEDSEEGDYDL